MKLDFKTRPSRFAKVYAVAVSVLLLLQPALAAVWGVAFLDERLIAIQVAGIAIVLSGVTIARPRTDQPSGTG